MAMAYADLLIGAHGYPCNSGKGRSYVVFGGPGVGSSGILAFPVLMALMALNWMGKIMVISVAIP